MDVLSEALSRIEYVIMPDTVSAILNNFVVKQEYNRMEVAAIIHHDVICIFSSDSSFKMKDKFIECSKYTKDEYIQVTQVFWCQLGCETKIIVTSSAGLHVFSQSGEECEFFHPCSDPREGNTPHFARGVAQFSSSYFCIGNSAGCIRMFGSPTLENEVTFIDRKHEHQYPIVDLSTFEDHLASVDEEGTVFLWKKESLELVKRISVKTMSNCTGISLRKDWLILIFGSGHIRMYSIRKEISNFLVLSVEIMAHAKAITGSDVSENNEYLLTVSEDSYAKIWQLIKQGNKHVIRHMHDIPVKDNILMGGKFLDSNGKRFCVTAYDSNILTCFTLRLDINMEPERGTSNKSRI